MTTSPVSKFAATLFSLLVLSFPPSPACSESPDRLGNTAFADPPVPRPHTTPCKVTLYKGFEFADFNPKSFTYTPPAACPAPWAKVILQANFSINQGTPIRPHRQHLDRPHQHLLRHPPPRPRTPSPATGTSSAISPTIVRSLP